MKLWIDARLNGMSKKRTIIIDHYDSFTYLLSQYIGELHGNPIILQHDQCTLSQIKRLQPTHIILSPGPGTVENSKDFRIGFSVIKAFYRQVPILGVCLGHQGIVRFFGGEIVRVPKVMHGKRSQIHHTEEGIFKGLPNPLEVMRYHSLIADSTRIPPELKVTARTQDNLVMAVEHREFSVFGVQFHPESIGTPEGKKIIRNFLAQ